MADTAHSGGCMCGSVRYRLTAEPMRVGLCHCETCRRNTGAAFGVFAVVRRGDLQVLSGETGWFQSSPVGKRHFCRSCGSPVFSEWTDSDDIDVYVGSLDEPERLEPSYELWTVRRLPWLSHLGQLKRYERNRT